MQRDVMDYLTTHNLIVFYWKSKLITNLLNENRSFLFPPVVGQADNVPDNSRMDEPT